MRIVVYGMALTMIAQPSGGSDSCQIACSRPQLKGATPSLGVPVVAWVARPIASISSFGQRTRKSTVGRLVASKTVTPRIEILSFEHPAFSNQNVMGGDRNELLHGASAPTLTDSLNSDAARVKATIGVDRHSVGVAKSPQQQAQDTWDARQTLAYVDPIIPTEFAYVQIQETASGALKIVPRSSDWDSAEPGSDGQPAAAQIREIENNKSQALSVPMVGQQMELLSK
jgi:hypothetical protein